MQAHTHKYTLLGAQTLGNTFLCTHTRTDGGVFAAAWRFGAETDMKISGFAMGEKYGVQKGKALAALPVRVHKHSRSVANVKFIVVNSGR